jgi:hypothetical protein
VCTCCVKLMTGAGVHVPPPLLIARTLQWQWYLAYVHIHTHLCLCKRLFESSKETPHLQKRPLQFNVGKVTYLRRIACVLAADILGVKSRQSPPVSSPLKDAAVAQRRRRRRRRRSWRRRRRRRRRRGRRRRRRRASSSRSAAFLQHCQWHYTADHLADLS